MSFAANLAEKLVTEHDLSEEELLCLLEHRQEVASYVQEEAQKLCQEVFGKEIYIRGLLEISNICKNDCYYCGIRKSNRKAERYRLTEEEILEACRAGYALGFRTFVLQGGEDMWYDDDCLCHLVSAIRKNHPDCAITLSVGERSRESYEKLFAAGANRYLLRHETATASHYAMLHPSDMDFANRMRCLQDLKEIGYQVGCGFMVGSPHQTLEHLVKDLRFLKEFQPHMVGIGPFLSQKDTPFAHYENGSGELTLFLLAVIRLLLQKVLLPSTTALRTLLPPGKEWGIVCGANVIMPNLSPMEARKKYTLYDNKRIMGTEAAEQIEWLKKELADMGYTVAIARGDSPMMKEQNH